MGASRPLLITIIGALYALVGVLAILAGIVLAIGGAASDALAAGAVGGGIVTIVGLIYIVIALGFFKGWKLWWYLGVLFSIIGIILGLLSFPAGLLVVIIQLIILWYLFRDNVKAFFFD
ncbi:MAG TPA: hypothetical protein IAC83_04480 [Euryarchaeota archaeon]|nr:hypothetical protein [Euryarchaeota archaeon]